MNKDPNEMTVDEITHQLVSHPEYEYIKGDFGFWFELLLYRAKYLEQALITGMIHRSMTPEEREQLETKHEQYKRISERSIDEEAKE